MKKRFMFHSFWRLTKTDDVRVYRHLQNWAYHSVALAIYARAGALVCALAAVVVVVMISKRKVLKYRRASLFRFVRGVSSTQLRQIFTHGRARDFLVRTNITKDLLERIVVPAFEHERKKDNFGSPYGTSRLTRGGRALLESFDLDILSVYYMYSRDAVYKMCPIFGIVPSSAHAWLDFSMEVLLRVVKHPKNPWFEIRLPNEEQIQGSAALLENDRVNGHLLRGILAVMDGDLMPCATYRSPELQKSFWEGFTQAEEVSNLLVWNMRGEIIHAGVNYPVSWYDRKTASQYGLYYHHLTYHTPTGYAVVCDSAFTLSIPAL